jgi:hypothetical protein
LFAIKYDRYMDHDIDLDTYSSTNGSSRFLCWCH